MFPFDDVIMIRTYDGLLVHKMLTRTSVPISNEQIPPPLSITTKHHILKPVIHSRDHVDTDSLIETYLQFKKIMRINATDEIAQDKS